ncbi:MAG: hypothetical protein J7M25_05910 [Deltaproteobacteria bacterium]|nr:hypothetical protein [Deltaproteobacteria bacterium]
MSTNRLAAEPEGSFLRRLGMAVVLASTSFASLVSACNDDGTNGNQQDGGIDGSVQNDAQTNHDGTLSDGTTQDAKDGQDGSMTDGGDGGTGGCHSDPGPGNKERFIVVSHPFTANGQDSSEYETATLAKDGTVAFTGNQFQMGKSSDARIVFTPDGKVGIVPQIDGTLGAFTIDESGQVQVTHAAFSGSFYASSLVMDPTGDRVYLLDSQWRNNGGGIYSVRINCDGTLADEGLVAPAKLAYAMVLLKDQSGRAIVYATDILSSEAGKDAHMLQWQGATPTLLTSAPLFGTDEAIVSSAAVTDDGTYFLVGDNCGFCTSDNRVGIMAIGSNSLTLVDVLTSIEDPMDIQVSPYNNAAIVVSGFGNAVFGLAYDPTNQAHPFTNQGEITYNGQSPQLPARSVMLTRGPLRGTLYLAENMGIRVLRFESNGGVTDVNMISSGSGTDRVVGSIGVQP